MRMNGTNDDSGYTGNEAAVAASLSKQHFLVIL